MTLPPERLPDSWEGSFLLEPARPLRDISVGGGLVIAGGDALHMLRPGDLRPGSRRLPPDAAPVTVAVEPWAPFRYAVASRGQLEICSGGERDEPLQSLRFSKPEAEPTHLAWARHQGESMLYFRGRDSQVGRLRPQRDAFEYVNASPTAAIAGDASGVLALISLVPGEETVDVSREGGGFEVRPLTMIPVADPDEDMHVYLAVSGRAVAYSVNDFGTLVSWSEGEDFEFCGGLMWGPIAFHGDDALFGAYSVERTSSVSRMTRQGAVTRVAEVKTSHGPPPTITALAWDGSRSTLWGASPELGWLMSKQQARKVAKASMLS